MTNDLTQLLYRTVSGAGDISACSRLDERTFTDLVQLSRLNRVTLLLRERLPASELPLGHDAILDQASRRAEAKLDAAAGGLGTLKAFCEQHGWPWLLFKTSWSFRKEVSDLDILVPNSPHILDDIAHALPEIGAQVAEREEYKLKVYCPIANGQTSVLDFHTKITQDDMDFFDEEQVMAGRRKVTMEGREVFAASAGDDFLAICLESFFGDSILNVATIVELRYRRDVADVDIDQVRRRAEARGWLEPVDSVLYATDLTLARLTGAPAASVPAPASLSPVARRRVFMQFGRGEYYLPRFFPADVVSYHYLRKGARDATFGEGRRVRWLRNGIQGMRRQLGARLYRIPMKVDGVVVKLP